MRYWLSPWVLAGLKDGSIDHLDYLARKTVARVVFPDGSECLIDVAATREREDIERAESRRRTIEAGGMVFPVTMRALVESGKFRGVVYSAGN